MQGLLRAKRMAAFIGFHPEIFKSQFKDASSRFKKIRCPAVRPPWSDQLVYIINQTWKLANSHHQLMKPEMSES